MSKILKDAVAKKTLSEKQNASNKEILMTVSVTHPRTSDNRYGRSMTGGPRGTP